MNVTQALAEGKKILKLSNVSEYAIDTELFLMKVLGFSKVMLFTENNYVLNESEIKAFFEFIEKRKNGIPTQYIIGNCEFMGFNFNVNSNVLIPRCDTEILVEEILKISKREKFKKFVEIGTGSGCIAVSLCRLGNMTATAVDISEKALEKALENACINNVDNKIDFIQSDIFENLSKDVWKDIDFIVSNPPYIPTAEIETLMKEVKDNEPFNALDGGKDGLYFYKKIISEGAKLLKNNGFIFFEIGYNQAEDVTNILLKNGFSDICVVKDLAGLDRVVFGKK